MELLPRLLNALHLSRAEKLVAARALLQPTLRDGPPSASQRDVEADGGAGMASGRTTPPRHWNGAHAPTQTRAENAPGRFIPQSFSNAAGSRTYKLYIPSSYEGRPCPLIVMLHGCTQSADDFAAGTQMNVLADEHTFLVAYPEQSAAANLLKCWNWFNRREQQRDRGEPSLIAGLTRQVMRDYAVDRNRVYVAGLSAGAAAAAVLGDTYPDIFAAVGVHSGVTCGLAHDLQSGLAAMRSGEGNDRAGGPKHRLVQNHRPVATIVFHGDRDTTVHPRNGDRFAVEIGAAGYNQRVETGQVAGGRAFTRRAYVDASGQSILEQWVIHGAGHAWSGGSASGSYTDPLGPDASRQIVRFFLSHRHGG